MAPRKLYMCGEHGTKLAEDNGCEECAAVLSDIEADGRAQDQAADDEDERNDAADRDDDAADAWMWDE